MKVYVLIYKPTHYLVGVYRHKEDAEEARQEDISESIYDDIMFHDYVIIEDAVQE